MSIRLFICDVDGVLTDGKLFFGADGEEGKFFHVHDGQGLKLLQNSGVTVAIISARHSKAVIQRMRDLAIEHVYLGEQNKLARLNTLCCELNISLNEVAYMGDDVADLACMQAVKLAIAPANAVAIIRQAATKITHCSGGEGAVREACDFLLNEQQKYVTA